MGKMQCTKQNKCKNNPMWNVATFYLYHNHLWQTDGCAVMRLTKAFQAFIIIFQAYE